MTGRDNNAFWSQNTIGQLGHAFRSGFSLAPYSLSRVLAIHALCAGLKIVMNLVHVAEIFFEEAQYWTWSLFPDLSYYSKPPLIAYANLFSTSVLGVNLNGIRINAIVCGLVIAWAIYQLAWEMYGSRKIAFYASLSLLAFPYFWLISFFFTTDSLLLLFWSLSVLHAWRALQGNNESRWWLGVTAGLGMLSKYTMFAFWPFMIILVVYKGQSVYKYTGPFLLSILIFLPVIIWNYTYDWLTVKHLVQLSTGSGTLNITQSLRQPGEFLAGQFISVFLFFPVLLSQFLWRVLRGRGDFRENFIGIPVISTLLIFLVISVNKTAQVNWTFFIYPPLALIVGFHAANSRIRLKTAFSIVLLLAFFSLPLYAGKIGIPAKVNPFRRLMGWPVISEKVADMLNSNKSQSVEIISDYYINSSLLSFYLPSHPLVYVIDYDRRMSQHDLWQQKINQDPGTNYLFFYQKESALESKFKTRFSDPLDSTRIVYHFNDQDSIEFNAVLYNSFNGFNTKNAGNY